MTDPEKGKAVSFPIKEAILGPIALVFGNFAVFLRAAWLPVVIFVAASVWASTQIAVGAAPPAEADPEALLAFMMGPGGFFEVMAFKFLTLLLLVPAITSWIRLTVLGPPEDGRFALFPLGRPELMYVVSYIVVAVLSAVAMFCIMIAMSLVGSILLAVIGSVAGGVGANVVLVSSFAGTILGLAAYIFVTARLLPVLGGAAFGENIDITGVWRETNTVGRPLFWAVLSFGILLVLGQFLIAWIVNAVAGGGAAIVAVAVMAAVQALAILIGSAFIGQIYAGFRA